MKAKENRKEKLDRKEKKKYRIPSPAFYFEPKDPILNAQDFLMELIYHCDSEGKKLEVLKEGMEPVVVIDGIKYVCFLEIPRMVHFPLSIFFASYTLGYKFVYLYEYEKYAAG